MTSENHDIDSFWRKQYELLITLQYQEANRFWTRFQISLAINSALLIAFSALISEDPKNVLLINILALIISIIGVVFSVIWNSLSKAGQLWQDYWINKGIELENIYNNELRVKIFSEIPSYEDKAPVRKLRSRIPIIFIITWSILSIVSLLVVIFSYGYSLD